MVVMRSAGWNWDNARQVLSLRVGDKLEYRPECTRVAIRTKQARNNIEAEVFERQARICKAFANATRLQLLDFLGKREWAAADLQKQLGISKANLSQHVAVLKAAGIVGTRRKGRQVYFTLVMPEVKGACRLIRDVLRAQVRSGKRLIF
jgi:DNA-binding transcriptional ArsR family regulator